MKFVSYNIQYGFGRDGRYDLARAVASVADADVIALQEVERHWRRSNFDDQPEIIGRLLPEHYWVYGPAFDMDASFRDGGRLVNRRRQFGTMLLSRTPILWSRLHLLPMRKAFNPLNTQNPALEGMINTPAGPIRAMSLHLGHIGVDERLEQIDFLMARHRNTPFEGGPWSGRDDEPGRDWTHGEAEPQAPLDAIWMGDFNSEPGSREYRRIAGEAPYHDNAVYAGGFVDPLAQQGDFYTHERQFRGARQRRRLDYCFVGAGLASRVRRSWIDHEAQGSDHLPVWTEIDLDQQS